MVGLGGKDMSRAIERPGTPTPKLTKESLRLIFDDKDALSRNEDEDLGRANVGIVLEPRLLPSKLGALGAETSDVLSIAIFMSRLFSEPLLIERSDECLRPK